MLEHTVKRFIMWDYLIPVFAGFVSGAVYNMITNGPHIGCCHTYRTVFLGSAFRGGQTIIAFIPLYYVATQIFKFEPGFLLGSVLSYMSLCLVLLYDKYRHAKMMKEISEKARRGPPLVTVKRD